MAALQYAAPQPSEMEFFRVLQTRVFEHLRSKGQMRYANGAMWLRIGFFFAGFTVSWYTLVFVYLPTPCVVALCFALSFFGTGIALNVGHEASHRNLSRYRWIDPLLYWISMTLLGSYHYTWRVGHIATHHKYVNVPGHDVGIEANGVLRFASHTAWRPKFVFQHLYAVPLYCLYTLTWVLFRDWRVMAEGTLSGVKLERTPGKFLELFLTKLFYFAYILWIPLAYSRFSSVQVIGGFLLVNVVYSLYFACFLFVSHLAMEPTYAEPDEHGRLPVSYLRHQLASTMDVMPISRIASFCLGGFNTHAIHHLFPHICGVHHLELTKILKTTCAEFGMPYLECGLSNAIRSHFRFLHKMGQPSHVGSALVAGKASRGSTGATA